MESAIFGLVGVVVGSLITVFKDWWLQNRKTRKDAEYLVIQVSCALERYISICAEVVIDDGLCDGQTDEEDCRVPQVKYPTFDPKLFDVNWKSLPIELMYRVFELQYRGEEANRKIDYIFGVDQKPDYSEGFKERQFQYATLGIKAFQLVADLRHNVGLPVRETKEIAEWDPVKLMNDTMKDIEAQRKERDNRC